MTTLRTSMLVAAAVALAGPVRVHAAPAADITPPEKRRPVVESAQRLAQPPNVAPLPAELVHPFNPAAFGQPDPEELRAIAAAQAAAQAAQTAAKPTTDREFLQVIAARITPSGTVIVGDEPWLIFGKRRLRVGDRLTVTYDGQDYQLELAGIDRTNFTLRLNRDEITRPIKPGKTP